MLARGSVEREQSQNGAGQSVFNAPQRIVAGQNVTIIQRNETVAGPARRLCKICGTSQNEDDCFECLRCKRWVCQTHKDPVTLLCASCAEAFEAAQARGATEAGQTAARPQAPSPSSPTAISTVATLSVRTMPADAEVLVDARPVGRTPIDHPIDLGVVRQRQVEVLVRKEGHVSQAASIQLCRGAVSQWHGVVLARQAASDLPDPTEVKVQEIFVAPLEVEIEAKPLPQIETEGLPPVPPELLRDVATLETLRRTIAAIGDGTHPSLRPAQDALQRAHEQQEKLSRILEQVGQSIPNHLRRRLISEAARRPDSSISQLASLAPRVPGDDLLRFLYTLRHMQHAERVAKEAQETYQRARQAKAAELRIQADALAAELSPRLEEDFAEVVLEFLQKANSPASFPLEGWLKLEPLLASRPYPWDRRTLLGKAESLHRNLPDHTAWREARTLATPKSLRGYLAQLPTGRHAEEAKAMLAASESAERGQDDRDWELARSADAVEAVQAYLACHADGRHAAAARGLLARIAHRKRALAVKETLARANHAVKHRRPSEAAVLLQDALRDPGNCRFSELWSMRTEIAGDGPRQVSGACAVRRLSGHAGRVCAVQIALDGECAVSAGSDKKLLVWDLRSRSCLGALVGHTAAVTSVVVLPNGRTAISGSCDFCVRVWDLQTLQCLQVFRGHQDTVNGVCSFDDGRRAASCSCDGTVRIWDLERAECGKILTGHTGEVRGVTAAPEGRQLLSCGQDGSLRVWDLQDGSCLKMLRASSEALNAVAVSSDGRFAATAGNDHTVRLWDLQTDQCAQVCRGHQSRVLAVHFDGRGRVLSTSRDKTIRAWEMQSGKPLHTFEGHQDEVTDVAMSEEGGWAISSSFDGTLRVWCAGPGECQGIFGPSPGSIVAIAAAPDAERIVAVGADRKIRCLDGSGREPCRLLAMRGAAPTCLAVSPDSRRAVSVASSGNAEVWDLDSGRTLASCEGFPESTLDIAFVEGRDAVVVAGHDGRLIEWNLATGTMREVCGPWGSELSCLTICNEANVAVGGTPAGELVFWDLSARKLLRRQAVGQRRLVSVAFSPEERCACTIDERGQLRFFRLAAGNVLGTDESEASCAVIGANGTWAASGHTNGDIVLWEPRSGARIANLPGHHGPVSALAIPPKSEMLVSGGVDAVIKVWHLLWNEVARDAGS